VLQKISVGRLAEKAHGWWHKWKTSESAPRAWHISVGAAGRSRDAQLNVIKATNNANSCLKVSAHRAQKYATHAQRRQHLLWDVLFIFGLRERK
jgi:hypothetical protein